MPSELCGQLIGITYNDPESGFTVARVRVDDRQEPVTVVGTLIGPAAGEMISMHGEWTTHPRFGPQFRISSYQTEIPTTTEGLEKYLGSGLLPGIGPVMAERILAHFGDDTLHVMDHDIQRLTEIRGIGKKRINAISTAWAQQRGSRDVMMFLQSQGIGTGLAARIIRAYGQGAAGVVRHQPYRLATDISGIGFTTADRIARHVGMAADDPSRVRAGLLYQLAQGADSGHVYTPRHLLVAQCCRLMDVPADRVDHAIDRCIDDKRIVREAAGGDLDHEAVYLQRYHRCEVHVAARLTSLLAGDTAWTIRHPEKALDRAGRRLGITLAPRQRQALHQAFHRKVLIITGGPGTGKTTLINAILSAFHDHRGRALLAAPTGRAAKRMAEATGHPARTIHRLLEYRPQQGGFQKNARNPLACDLIVVDEASMIDIVLMTHLLDAVPDTARVILVGDIHQLPSVGPGNVLNDCIDSGMIPVVRLTDIFRQAARSRIIVSAHDINAGRMPDLATRHDGDDFYFIERAEPEAICDVIGRLVTERIPRGFTSGGIQLDPVDDIQVITPMHRGPVGSIQLNAMLQQQLNPSSSGVTRGDRRLAVNDKVMQVRNNYDRQVFNGDIGRVAGIDPEARELDAVFEGRRITYDFADLDELELAYAVSVHKAQGSEYPAVVIPVTTQHYVMLQRNLIYTAVTRGRRLVVLVGSKKALRIGISNWRTVRRHSRLRQRLAAADLS